MLSYASTSSNIFSPLLGTLTPPLFLDHTFIRHHLFIYLFIYLLFIYLFLAVLGLRCCAWAFSSCSERGLLFVVVHGLLTVVASLVAEHRLEVRGLQ